MCIRDRCLAITPIVSQPQIDQGNKDVSYLVKIKLDVDDLFVQNEMPPSPLGRGPKQNTEKQIDPISQRPLPKSCEGQPVQRIHARIFMT